EVLYGMDPTDTDTDDDSLLDGIEVSNYDGRIDLPFEYEYGTEDDEWINVCDPDANGNKIVDGYEIITVDADKDNDGLLDYKYDSNNTNQDIDTDGMQDGDEWLYWWSLGIDPKNDTDNDGIPNFKDTDSDNDNITDGEELMANYTKPENKDTDGDKLKDYEEIAIYQTNPRVWDTDGDLLMDGYERDFWIHHLGEDGPLIDSDTDGFWNILDHDSDNKAESWFERDEKERIVVMSSTILDGDRLRDGEEVNISQIPQWILLSDPAKFDTDEDKLYDGKEIIFYKTNAWKKDTDNDGLMDGVEVEEGLLWGMRGELKIYAYTNPLVNDTDDDGLIDGGKNLDCNTQGEYLNFHTDPTSNDTDGDMLSDYIEITVPALWMKSVGNVYLPMYTNATNPDTDRDGLTDGEELLGWDWSKLRQSKVLIEPPKFAKVSGEIFRKDTKFPVASALITLAGTKYYHVRSQNDGKFQFTSIPYGKYYLSVYHPKYKLYELGNVSIESPEVNLGQIRLEPMPEGKEAVYLPPPLSEEEITTNEYYNYTETPFFNFTDPYRMHIITNPLSNDTDKDGLDDLEEKLNVTNPCAADTDNDTLTDGQEVHGLEAEIGGVSKTVYTDPHLADTDLDGLNDNLEVYRYSTDPLDNDTDEDGLFDGTEVWVAIWYNVSGELKSSHTNPLRNDTDGDGLNDWDEIYFYATNPLLQDSDSDNLTDGFELSYPSTKNHLNPLINDTDGDGLEDGEEKDWFGANATEDYDNDKLENILDPDSDNDGILDGWERNANKNPRNNDENRNKIIDGKENDYDCDGIMDYYETYIKGIFNITDTDNDGLLDSEELNAYRTDPYLNDTDKDGWTDFDEIKNHADPLSSKSHPPAPRKFGTAIIFKEKKCSKKLYLHLYDSKGRHIGFNYTANETTIDIPDATYFDFYDGVILITLPPDVLNFDIIIDGKYAEEAIESYNLTIVTYKDSKILDEFYNESSIGQYKLEELKVRISEKGEVHIIKPKPQAPPLPLHIIIVLITVVMLILIAVTVTLILKQRKK
ncbi:MAG: hypothetical protein AB1779_10040, partial [Candidatus Thermoplasmatota archaeon]